MNKTDRNDARGIAQMMRVNLFRPVHVKTLPSQKCRALLTARKLLQEKAIVIENDIRGLLRNFGLKVGVVSVVKFEEGIRELVEDASEIGEINEPLLAARRKLREEFARLHRKLLSIVGDDEVCKRLMTIPGVGPVTALAFTRTPPVPASIPSAQINAPREAKFPSFGEVFRTVHLAFRPSGDGIPTSRPCTADRSSGRYFVRPEQWLSH